MLNKDECWMQNYCKKYKNNNCIDPVCIKLTKLDILYNNALLSMNQRKHIALRIDSDGVDREVFSTLKSIEKNIVNFIDEGKNLYLYSSICGNGKTAWACRLLQAYLENIWIKCSLDTPALFIHIPSFFIASKDSIKNQIQNPYVEHIRSNIDSAKLVIWDEVAVKALTQYEHETLLSMINSRLNKHLSNIYTSNLSGEVLLNNIGDRLYSRVVNHSTILELRGRDKRGLI